MTNNSNIPSLFLLADVAMGRAGFHYEWVDANDNLVCWGWGWGSEEEVHSKAVTHMFGTPAELN